MTDFKKAILKTEKEKDALVKSFTEALGEEYDAADPYDEPFTTELISFESMDGKKIIY